MDDRDRTCTERYLHVFEKYEKGTKSVYNLPRHTASRNSAPLSRRKVDSATCNIFQINTIAFFTFSKRLVAVVRSRTVAKRVSITLLVRKCTQ
jgi:hypothetical protein